MRFAPNARRDLSFEETCSYLRESWSSINDRQCRREDARMGSDGRHGMAALVPNRSLTCTTIIGSD